MNKEQFAGVIRHLLGAIGAYVVSQGILDQDLATQASGAVATLAAIAWSLFEKRK